MVFAMDIPEYPLSEQGQGSPDVHKNENTLDRPVNPDKKEAAPRAFQSSFRIKKYSNYRLDLDIDYCIDYVDTRFRRFLLYYRLCFSF